MKLIKNPVFLHYFNKFMGILFISLLLKMINGFSWPAKIMANPFNLRGSFQKKKKKVSKLSLNLCFTADLHHLQDHFSNFLLNLVLWLLVYTYQVTMPTSGCGDWHDWFMVEVVDMIDSLIFIHSTKSHDILQIRKCSCRWLAERYNCRISWKVWRYFIDSQIFREPW